jgi:hypothetical protein
MASKSDPLHCCRVLLHLLLRLVVLQCSSFIAFFQHVSFGLPLSTRLYISETRAIISAQCLRSPKTSNISGHEGTRASINNNLQHRSLS